MIFEIVETPCSNEDIEAKMSQLRQSAPAEAKAVEAAKKDKRAGISTLAYIETYKYPENVKLADNVSVQLCPVVYSWWHPLVRERQYSMYKKWIEKEGV